MRTTDTIAAIATGMTPSGIGIIRVSGEDSIAIVEKIAKLGNTKERLSEAPTHTIHYGHIVYEGEVIDEVLISVMRAPHTYTGEDTIEINCHGGILVMQKVLDAVVKSGANLAEPGEFTKRAFLNGKMDLSEAEAVMEVIDAGNAYALKSGMSQLQGKLSEKIKDIRDGLLHEIAYIEAALDDPEHYDLSTYPKALKKSMKPLIDKTDELIASADTGRVMKEGIATVIIGRPNAGKSSLLNLLAGDELAIVTDIAGTTRDTITEHIRMSGISLNLTDTAGIRDSLDPVEQIGVDRAKKAASGADLVLCIIDGSQLLNEDDKEILESIHDKEAIVLLNKSDLQMRVSKEDVSKYTSHKVIEFSALERIGLTELEDTIKDMFYTKKLEFNDQVYVTELRHKEALTRARESMDMVMSSIDEGQPEDFFSIDLLNAYEELGAIIGETVDDDVVKEIFAKFCMGK